MQTASSDEIAAHSEFAIEEQSYELHGSILWQPTPSCPTMPVAFVLS
jgi:hypothetical protein